jgi:chemotaxis protein CheD
VAKIAGGASMFQFQDKKLNMDIGSRNISAVRAALKELGIPILAEDTGGNIGRTMILDLESNTVSIVTMGKNIKIL